MTTPSSPGQTVVQPTKTIDVPQESIASRTPHSIARMQRLSVPARLTFAVRLGEFMPVTVGDAIESRQSEGAVQGSGSLPRFPRARRRHPRNGDRRLNQAFHMAVVNRIQHDPDTLSYVTRRIAEGHSNRENLRILKRYLARQVFRTLNALRAAPRQLDIR